MRSFLEVVLLRAWAKRGVLAYILWPCSKLFQLLLNFRYGLLMLGYLPQTKVSTPVIVVGNIFIGGTGKTPFVIWLAQQLKQAGKHPAVISRGYASSAENVTEVSSDSLASLVGDEPLLIAQHAACPVWVGRNRVAVANALLAAYPSTDVIISDDGLQHYALARDVEILMFDQRGVGNGWLLPAGPLREVASRRRDFTILNTPAEPAALIEHGDHENIDSNLAGLNGTAIRMHLLAGKVYQLACPENSFSLDELAQQPAKFGAITALAGIGHPERFFAMLRKAGIVFKSLALNDHHAFSKHSLKGLDAEMILMTEKDAVKCRQQPDLQGDTRLWVVPVEAQITSDLMPQILKMISEK